VKKTLLVGVVAIIAVTSVGAAGTVHVTMHDGLVSVDAQNATLRELLEAYAQAGQTTIANLEKIPASPPLTLTLTDVPEPQALDIVLRSLSGYLAMPRAANRPSASRYDRIVIVPTSAADRSDIQRAAAPPPFAPPAAPPQLLPQLPPEVAPPINGVARRIGPDGNFIQDDQLGGAPPPARPAVPQVAAPIGFSRGDAPPPVSFSPVPPPVAAPPAQMPNGGAVIGTSVPGMVVPAQPTPGNQPQQTPPTSR